MEVIQKDRSYACRVCTTFKFETELPVLRHVKAVHKQKISCPRCPALFLDPIQREQHLSKPHTSLSCDSCAVEFKFEHNLERHLAMYHLKRDCPRCGKSILKKDVLKHNRQCRPELLPRCGICDFTAKSIISVERHQRKVHMKEKNVAYKVCKAKFFDQGDLNKHMVRHKPNECFRCRFCKKQFPRKSAMRLHEKIHLNERDKKCSVCDASFVQKASLSYHMMKYHPGV